MALSGTFYANLSGTAYARIKIDWHATQDINGNFSDVTADLYIEKTSSTTWAYNLNTSGPPNGAQWTCNIDGTTKVINFTFDLRSAWSQHIGWHTVRVYHNADGTRQCTLSTSGTTSTPWGGWNFAQTVVLNTIPREAYITNSVDFVIGNNIPLTLRNDGNLFVRSHLYVNNTLIAATDHGQVTNTTIVLDSGHNNNIYATMPNSLSAPMFVRIQTFSDGGYTNKVGNDRDQHGTASIHIPSNTPIFGVVQLQNENKTIEVRDQYNNLLTTSSTTALLGSNNKMIKGVSKIKAFIASANRMQTRNHATPVKYVFNTATQQTEVPYSTGDVALFLDNVVENNFRTAAYDSRGLYTEVFGSLSYVANYFPIDITGLKFVRNNMVGTQTKLQFVGTMFKEYFGGGTSGEQNTATFHYRYKLSTESWGAQPWISIAPTISAAGNISFDSYINGDLGINGFDPNKSFTIQVRAFDKLSCKIIEGTLSRGIPVIDFTQKGIALKNKYDDTQGGALQIDGGRFPFVGMIVMGTAYEVPPGWLECNGQEVSRTVYAELFAKINTFYGPGNGTTTFNLPNLCGRVPAGHFPTDWDFRWLGIWGGTKYHTLSVAELPPHTHIQDPHSHTIIPNTANAYGIAWHTTETTQGLSLAHTGAHIKEGYSFIANTVATNQYTGGGQGHYNLQPYIVLKFYIKY